MRRSSLARLATTVLLAGATVTPCGCNSLLDNRPADVGSESFGSDPDDAGTGVHEAGRDAGASAPDPRSEEAGPTPLAPPCAAGAKPCGELCVSTDDPSVGCGGRTCEPCAPAHGTGACVAGECAVGRCASGWADCNGLAHDGCEVELSSASSCGACGVRCVATPNASVACTAGACVTTCKAGFADCNGDPVDGCETPILTDKHHCGRCGRACHVGSCEAGTCVVNL